MQNTKEFFDVFVKTIGDFIILQNYFIKDN